MPAAIRTCWPSAALGLRPRQSGLRPQPSKAAAKRRLSFKEKHALETLPARIDALRAELAKLNARLSDPELHERDAAGFARASSRYAEVADELTAAEDEWLNLEILREEIEG
jgi:ATP-binding cassette subfamily F protein uup